MKYIKTCKYLHIYHFILFNSVHTGFICKEHTFQPVLHDWFNKVHGMYYPVSGMVHIKIPLLLIGTSSACSGGSGFLLSLSERSITICPTPYHRKYNVLNKTCLSFLPVENLLRKVMFNSAYNGE